MSANSVWISITTTRAEQQPMHIPQILQVWRELWVFGQDISWSHEHFEISMTRRTMLGSVCIYQIWKSPWSCLRRDSTDNSWRQWSVDIYRYIRTESNMRISPTRWRETQVIKVMMKMIDSTVLLYWFLYMRSTPRCGVIHFLLFALLTLLLSSCIAMLPHPCLEDCAYWAMRCMRN